MIAISGVLVLVAIGLLVTGLVLPNLWFVYASIVVSLASAVCLVVGVFIGRGQAPASRARTKSAGAKASGGRTGGSAKKKTTGNRPNARKAAKVKAGAGARGGDTASTVTKTKTETEEPASDEARVVVVPGRLRYHLSSCRQVSGRDTEELDVDDARAQGYVACTACRPDTVLAARADHDDDDDDDVDADDVEDTPDADADADADAEPVTVVVVEGQRRYHLVSCPVVEDAQEDDAETRELTVSAATGEGLTACRVCGAPTD